MRESQFAYWLMQSHPDWEVMNRGVNGERSDQILARMRADISRLAPDVLVIIAGVNDIYQGCDVGALERNLAAMFEMSTIPVVAGSIIPYNTASNEQNARMHRVNDWIRAYAAGHPHVTFCDTRTAVASPGDPDRLVSSPDDLHPSSEGYRLMAVALEPAIQRAFGRVRGLQ